MEREVQMKMMMKRTKMMKRERKERAVRHRVAVTLYSKCSSTLRWLLKMLRMMREGRQRLTPVSSCGRACSLREHSLDLSSRYCNVLYLPDFHHLSHSSSSLTLFSSYSISMPLFLSIISFYCISHSPF